MTEKENYLLAPRGQDHLWVPEMRAVTEWIMPEWMVAVDPKTSRNFLGIEYTANENGRISSHARPVLSHISEWKDKVKFPDPASFDWKADAAKIDSASNPEKARMVSVSLDGLFLLLINLLGWVEGLCTIAEEPEIVGEFNEAATDFFIKCAKLELQYLKPDVIMLGDDVANEKGPFVSRACFQSLYKPYYSKLIGIIKAEGNGIPVEFHCCGRDEFLLDEFADMGVDIVQIPRPYDDLKAWKKRVGRTKVLTGGWDWQSKGGLPNATEAEVRAAARDVLDTWARNDPAYIFWEGDAIGEGEDMKNKVIWIRDEVAKYGKTIYT
jgi:uroporphyrinogen-III decarboxylase